MGRLNMPIKMIDRKRKRNARKREGTIRAAAKNK